MRAGLHAGGHHGQVPSRDETVSADLACMDALRATGLETPVLEEIMPGHAVSCHRARELSLRGVAE